MRDATLMPASSAPLRAARSTVARPVSHPQIVTDLVNGAVDAAERRLAAVLALDPRDADALALSARAAAMRNDRDRELALLGQALDVRPGDGTLLAMLARCLARVGSPSEADEAIRGALAGQALSEVALDDLATACRLLGRHRDATDLLARAVDEGSQNPAIFYNLGNNLKFVGDFDGARNAYRHAIGLAPDFHKVHAALSALGGAGDDAANLAEIERLIAVTRDPEALIHLRHAAAKRCDAGGRFDEAWTHLCAGKAQLIRSLSADPCTAFPAMDSLIDRLERGGIAPGPVADPTGPILVVGMPRSGTTVLDRLVSNHQQVTSIGESMYFAQLVKDACRSTSAALLDELMLSTLSDPVLLAEAGQAYEARLLLSVRPGTRFLDKLHLNFMLAPHLVTALPHARLLCVVRDPLDTIVGNFRQLFEFRSDIYRYSLDIEAAARFYVRFRRLADLMQEIAPERFMIVGYESLVADPEEEARRIFSFCALPWQAGCSRIERNEASVATASAVQVRAGIDRTYVGRWRRYAQHLDEARRILAHAGLPVD